MRAALLETTMTCGWDGLGNFSDEESRPAAQILSFRAKQPATTSTFAHEFNRDAPKPRFAWQSAAAPQEPVPVVPIGSGILPWQRAAESGKTASISRRWRRLVLNLAWKSPTSDPIKRHVDSPLSPFHRRPPLSHRPRELARTQRILTYLSYTHRKYQRASETHSAAGLCWFPEFHLNRALKCTVPRD